MKKVLKSKIFIVIITMIICISGTLYAGAKYQASEVIYNEMTVEDALNELYNNNKNNNIEEYISDFEIVASSGTNSNIVTLTVPTGTKSGYLFAVSSGYFLPELSIEGNGIKTQTLIGTWNSSDKNYSSNHTVNIYYCEFNELETITVTGTVNSNTVTSAAIITGLPNDLTIVNSKGVVDATLSLAVPDDIESGYVVAVVHAFSPPVLYIEGEEIKTQTLLGTLNVTQSTPSSSHIVKIYYCNFNSSKNINSYSTGSTISTAILK